MRNWIIVFAIGLAACCGLMWGLARKGFPVECLLESGQKLSGTVYAFDNNVSILEVADSVFYIDQSVAVLGYADAKVFHLPGDYAYVIKGDEPPALYLFDICVEDSGKGFSITNLGKKVREYDIDGVEMMDPTVPVRINSSNVDL